MQQHTLALDARPCGALQTNCYVIGNPDGNALVVDPGAEADQILNMIGERWVTAILLTHNHADHIGAVKDIQAATGAPVFIHPSDAPGLGDIGIDRWLEDGDVIAFGDGKIRVVHTPGHTPGMVSLLLPDERAIVGDTLFEGGPGKTWSPEQFETTLDTLKRVVLTWPDNTVCYPGHGNSFRLGDVRAAVEAFVAREHPADFYGDAAWEG